MVRKKESINDDISGNMDSKEDQSINITPIKLLEYNKWVLYMDMYGYIIVYHHVLYFFNSSCKCTMHLHY